MSCNSAKQTESQEMRKIVQQLWNSVPGAGSAVWKYSVPGRDHYSKQRETLELLCGALWHLQLGLELGDLPVESIVSFREKEKDREKQIPWEMWFEQYKELSIDSVKESLTINYLFRDSVNQNIRYLMQSMLFADAALRIDGVRWTLLGMYGNRGSMPEALAQRKEMEGWLDPSSTTFKKCTTALQKQVIIVTTYRDYIMHGETSTWRNEVLRRFREQEFTKLSLSQIVRACLDLWQELLNLTLTSKT